VPESKQQRREEKERERERESQLKRRTKVCQINLRKHECLRRETTEMFVERATTAKRTGNAKEFELQRKKGEKKS
jgi:hypothetical protein